MQKLKTIKDLHAGLKTLPLTKRDEVLTALGCDPKTSVTQFYELINGNRKIKPAEKTAIAAVYGVPVESIDWQDEKFLPE